MYISKQNQLLEGCFAIISIKRAFNKRYITWLFNIAKFDKKGSTVIYYIKKDIPILILRLLPSKHKIDADGEWNSQCTF